MLDHYRKAIQERVCAVCLDGIFDEAGDFVRCGLPADRTCPIEAYLPQVVDVVKSKQSPAMEDYVDVLRKMVCDNCIHNENGVCELRLHADCALDRYFLLVAGAVDEARAG